MKTVVFSTKPYDREFLTAANERAGNRHELQFQEAKLDNRTTPLARDARAVCCFVNDDLDADVLERLARRGVRLIALRCAGFNNVDLESAADHGITVARVPAYSPHAVAEHALGLILCLNRRIHKAHLRVRESNFELQGLMGFDLHGKTIGIVGTGKIGAIFASLLSGFGCRLRAFDIQENDEVKNYGVEYVELDELFAHSDIISLHCPLTPQTHHLIDGKALGKMKTGAMLINTSRGALVDAHAAIDALKSGSLGSLGLDVYEEEDDLFFENLSGQIIADDVFARLQTFPNVLITGHQAFFTREALTAIAETTINNLNQFEETGKVTNEVSLSGGS